MTAAATRSPDTAGESAAGAQSRNTVRFALAANLVIAVAKLGGGLVSGSGAMLSEAAHSLADSGNEVFLLVALRRSARPADALHPFGYGKERYVWSMLAAVGIFVTGACFSVYEGIHTIVSGGEQTDYYWLLYLVLAISLAADGSSWLKAVRQLLRISTREQTSPLDTARDSRDTTLNTVLAEDSTAVVGVVVAAAGLALHQLTGAAAWEGVASLVIGVLLAFAALRLGSKNMDLLIGMSATEPQRLAAWDYLEGAEGVDEVLEVLTMQIAPEQLLLAARVDLHAGIDSEHFEQVAIRIRQGLADLIPEAGAGRIFLDVTDATEDSSATARRIHRGLRNRAR